MCMYVGIVYYNVRGWHLIKNTSIHTDSSWRWARTFANTRSLWDRKVSADIPLFLLIRCELSLSPSLRYLCLPLARNESTRKPFKRLVTFNITRISANFLFLLFFTYSEHRCDVCTMEEGKDEKAV